MIEYGGTMEQLKIIITTACMLSLAVGLCNILKPSKIFERQVRFLTSMLFVIGISTSFLKIDWDLTPMKPVESTENVQTANLTLEAQSLILTETENQAERALHDLLKENNITCSDLQVSVHIVEGQRIYISEVSAVCNDTQHACEILRENLGEEVILHVAEMAR